MFLNPKKITEKCKSEEIRGGAYSIRRYETHLNQVLLNSQQMWQYFLVVLIYFLGTCLLIRCEDRLKRK